MKVDDYGYPDRNEWRVMIPVTRLINWVKELAGERPKPTGHEYACKWCGKVFTRRDFMTDVMCRCGGEIIRKDVYR